MSLAKRIDVHHHIVPPIYRDGLASCGIDRSGGKSLPTWSIEASLDLMAQLGIATAVCSISEPALYPLVEKAPHQAQELARRVNEYTAEMHQRYPQQFGAFALLPMPDVEAALAEAAYALDVLHLDGVGLLSNYQNDYLGNRIFDPLFNFLEQRRAVIYIHPSVPQAQMARPEFVSVDYIEEFCFNTTRAAANLIYSGTLERCPHIRPILSHMGGVLPYLRWRLHECFPGVICAAEQGQTPEELVHKRNLPVAEYVYERWDSLTKTPDAYLARFYYDTALAVDALNFSAVTSIAPDHLLFGTDAFYASKRHGQLFGTAVESYFTEAEQRYAVNRGNAEQLFPRFSQK